MSCMLDGVSDALTVGERARVPFGNARFVMIDGAPVPASANVTPREAYSSSMVCPTKVFAPLTRRSKSMLTVGRN